jgi:hypothetical protein
MKTTIQIEDSVLCNRELAELLIASTMTGIDEERYEQEYLLRKPLDQETMKGYISVNSRCTFNKLVKLEEKQPQI